ncbi:cache domain-containing protein [Pseudocnuella soli]|uniref:cache domain-containing protein n=1 Tax=Pseudocnuella soli TaxID=2502779 RepID=UPI00104BB36E|nr:cache domain-containing protein [Pseudocnuella soli]
MRLPDLTLRTRAAIFSFAFFLFSALLVFLFFFRIIPANTEELHRHGYTILRNIKTNIQETNRHRHQFYGLILDELVKPLQRDIEKGAGAKAFQHKKDSLIERVRQRLDSIKSPAMVVDASGNLPHTTDATRLKGALSKDKVNLTHVENNSMLYQPKDTQIAVAIGEPAADFLQPILKTQKTELFSAYLLLASAGSTSQLVYVDPELGVRPGTFNDTQFVGSQGPLHSNVRDVVLSGQAYKMFFEPFALGNHNLVLCGFVKAEEYQRRQREFSPANVSIIVAFFLFLIACLPIAKIFLLDRSQRLQPRDLKLLGVALFIAPAILSLLLMQQVLLKAGKRQVSDNLAAISAELRCQFRNEIKDAYAQLNVFDEMVAASRFHPNNAPFLNIGSSQVDATQAFKTWMATQPATLTYYPFDRVFWMNENGRQIIKVELGSNYKSFVDVSERDYFKTLKERTGLMVPFTQSDTMGLQPLYNWADGKFRFLVSKRSKPQPNTDNGNKDDQPFAAAISSLMPSVSHTVLSSGYGFCLIDEGGNVLVHSNMNRNLRENIFEKSGNSADIAEALLTRQATEKTMRLYGKNQVVNIAPVEGLPLYAVTYFDRNYLEVMNMELLTIDILTILGAFLLSFLIIWVVAYVVQFNFSAYPYLYTPLDNLKWLTPRPAANSYFTNATGCLLLHGLLLSTFLIIFRDHHLDTWLFVYLLVTTILGIASCIKILSLPFGSTDRDRVWNERINRNSFAIFGTAAGVAALAMFVVADAAFSAICGIALLVLLYMLWVNRNKDFLYRQIIQRKLRSGLQPYCLLLTVLLTMLVFLLPIISSWYDRNNELFQTLKKQQLFLAKAITDRQKNVWQPDANFTRYPKPLQEYLLLHAGVYPVYRDSIDRALPQAVPGQRDNYSRYTRTGLRGFGKGYENQFLYTSLRQNPADSAWAWLRYPDSGRVHFWYKNMGRPEDSIYIASQIPYNNFISTLFRWGSLGFVLMTVLLYWVISGLANRLFPSRFLHAARQVWEKNKGENFRRFGVYYSSEIAEKADLLANKEDYFNYEHKVIAQASARSKNYSELWHECNDREKILLYYYACYGLINYTNSAEIYSLINKGILIASSDELKFLSPGFRGYVLSQNDGGAIDRLYHEKNKNGFWQAFRTPFVVFLVSIGAFVFFTQETTFQKIILLITGLGSASSLLPQIFASKEKNNNG